MGEVNKKWQITYKRKPYGRKYGSLDEVLEAYIRFHPCLHHLGWKKVSE